MNYDLPRQPQGAPELERPTPAGIRQEQMPQSHLQDANLVNMIQGTVETNRILAEYLRRDLHTRREGDGTRANDRRGNSPKTCQVPKSLTFDGNSEWKTFIKKVNSYCATVGWAGDSRCDVMMWYLTGKAAHYYSNLLDRRPDLHYHQVESTLAKRYGRKDLVENLMAEYQTTRQKEYLDDWADRLLIWHTGRFLISRRPE